MNDFPMPVFAASALCERGHRIAVDMAKGHSAKCPATAHGMTTCVSIITRLYIHTEPPVIAYERQADCARPTITADTPLFNVSFMSGGCRHVWRPRVDEIVEVEQIAHQAREFKMTIRPRTTWDPPENLLFLVASSDGALVTSYP